MMQRSLKRFSITAVFVITATVAHAQTAKQDFERFVAVYAAESQISGFKPDHTSTRESRVAFLQRVVKVFCSPYIAMKRGSATRPISDEVVVSLRPGEVRLFVDFIRNGGSAGYEYIVGEPEHLPLDQPLVNPLTLERLPEGVLAPTVPNCMPTPGPILPTPDPEPVPVKPSYPPYPPNEADVDAAGVALFADFAEAGQNPNSAMFRFAFRVAYDWLTYSVESLTSSVTKHRAVWREILGLTP